PFNNVTRTTLEAFAAVAGHTQSLHTNALDEALAGAHKLLVPAVMAEMARLGRPDIVTIVGGGIPPGDHAALFEAGVAAIFGPGTVIPVAAGQILDHVCRRFRA
ncbi:MAG: methylmalonyl-CoA mutase family protein, partial [Acidobacteriota bacterium]